MSKAPEMPLRLVALFLIFSFILVIVSLGIVSYIAIPPADPGAPKPGGNDLLKGIFMVIGAGALAGSVVLAWTKIKPKIIVGEGAAELLPAKAMMTRLMICLALAELPALLGFVYVLQTGHSGSGVPFFGGSLMVISFCILPATMAYLQAAEPQGTA